MSYINNEHFSFFVVCGLLPSSRSLLTPLPKTSMKINLINCIKYQFIFSSSALLCVSMCKGSREIPIECCGGKQRSKPQSKEKQTEIIPDFFFFPSLIIVLFLVSIAPGGHDVNLYLYHDVQSNKRGIF